MSQRHCLNHKDRPAVGLCHQCHAPICEECRYEAPADGLFCSQQCYDRYVAYQSRKQAPHRPGRLKSLAVGLFLLLILAAAAVVVVEKVLGIATFSRLF